MAAADMNAVSIVGTGLFPNHERPRPVPEAQIDGVYLWRVSDMASMHANHGASAHRRADLFAEAYRRTALVTYRIASNNALTTKEN